MMLQQDDDGCNAFAQDIIDSGGQGHVWQWVGGEFTGRVWDRSGKLLHLFILQKLSTRETVKSKRWGWRTNLVERSLYVVKVVPQ